MGDALPSPACLMSVPSATNSKPHWPALDGLRAFAVVAVMLYHAELGVAVNGYLGVDVFFVLSGFLITSLLLHERSGTGRVNLSAFYMRRLLRLYPALVLVAVGVMCVALVTGQQVAAIGQGAVATLLYFANIWIYTGNDTILLQHSWTLALEEQFYLVWPPILVVLLMLSSRARGAAVFLIFVVATIIYFWPMHGDSESIRASYLRAAGLLYGCALALAHRRGLRCSRIIAIACGMLLGVLTFGPFTVPESLFTSGINLAALLALPVVLELTRDARWSVLASPAARWFGRRSYGLYLWHFPILSLVVHHMPGQVPHWMLTTSGLGLSVLVAALSYRYVEEPFLRRKARFEVVKPEPGIPVTAEPGSDSDIENPSDAPGTNRQEL